MKLTLSLIPRPPQLVLPFTIVIWFFALLFVIIASVAVYDGSNKRREMANLEERLKELTQKAAIASTPAAIPPKTELFKVREHVQALNTLSQLRGWSTPTLLMWLEAHLPDKVHLVNMHHHVKEGEILLIAEASNAQDLIAFLLKLEEEPRFSQVLLSKQGARNESGKNTVQFEIHVKERLP